MTNETKSLSSTTAHSNYGQYIYDLKSSSRQFDDPSKHVWMITRQQRTEGGNRKGPGGEIVLPILCNPSFYHFVFIYKAPAGIKCLSWGIEE